MEVSADGTLLAQLFKKHGLVPGRDIPLLNVGATRVRFTSLMSGVIDACTLVIPWSLEAKEAGFRELVSFMDEDVILLLGSIVTHEKLLKSEPETVEKYVRATLKGHIYARENRSGSISVLMRKLKLRRDLAEKTYDITKPAIASDGTVNKEMQKKYFNLVATLRGIKTPPSLWTVFRLFSGAKDYC